MTAPRKDRPKLKSTLAQTEPFSNRGRTVKIFRCSAHPRGHGSLRGQSHCRNIRSETQVLQGPQRGEHLVPPQRLATQSPAPSPPGRSGRILCPSGFRASCQAGSGETVQRNGSPERQIAWRMTESFRARATRALPAPDLAAIASAQSFRAHGRRTRVWMTTAAS